MERAGTEDIGDEVECKGFRTPATKADVIEKLSLGDLWAVITGYDDNKNLPYLMKSRRSPQLDKDWYNKLTNIVFITDQYDSTISLSESLNHMIHHLNTSSRNKLEQKIYQKLETEPDGKKLGCTTVIDKHGVCW